MYSRNFSLEEWKFKKIKKGFFNTRRAQKYNMEIYSKWILELIEQATNKRIHLVPSIKYIFMNPSIVRYLKGSLSLPNWEKYSPSEDSSLPIDRLDIEFEEEEGEE